MAQAKVINHTLFPSPVGYFYSFSPRWKPPPYQASWLLPLPVFSKIIRRALFLLHAGSFVFMSPKHTTETNRFLCGFFFFRRICFCLYLATFVLLVYFLASFYFLVRSLPNTGGFMTLSCDMRLTDIFMAEDGNGSFSDENCLYLWRGRRPDGIAHFIREEERFHIYWLQLFICKV